MNYKIYFENIPDELKKLPQWVLWKLEENGTNKPTKIPYQINGKKASSTNPLHWSSFEKVVYEHLQNESYGIGFVFTKDDNLCGIDFDNSLDDNGNIDPTITDKINDFNSYTEISQSGKGFHIICKGEINGNRNRIGKIEIYDCNRYFALTGNVFGEYRAVKHCQETIDKFYNELFKVNKDNGNTLKTNFDSKEKLSDEEILNKLKRSKIGNKYDKLFSGDYSDYPSQSEADLALCNQIAFYTQSIKQVDRLFRKSKLFREKWDEKRGNITYGILTINNALKNLTNVFDKKNKKNENENSEILKFPENLIGGIAGDFAKLFSNYLEVPTEFLFISFLTCLGSIFSGLVTLKSELVPQPRLYILLLGESADDRKSTAITKTIDFFKSTMNHFNVCNGIGSAEGLFKKFNSIESERKNLLLCFDEFKNFVSKCKIDTSVLLPCVTTLFENNSYESHTKKTSIDLDKNIHLSLLAASTIQTYERTWDSSFTDIGFNNRLFLVPGRGKRKFAIPEEIPESDKIGIKNRLVNSLQYFNQYPKLEIEKSAFDIYEDWYLNFKCSIHSKRLDTYAFRFMILFALNYNKQKIDVDIINKVISICDWQYKVRQLYDPIDAENNIALLEESIRRNLKNRGNLTDRSLKQYTNAYKYGLWYYTTAISNLEKSHEIAWNKNNKAWFLK